MSSADAVKAGAMVEPAQGDAQMPLLADPGDLGLPPWAIVEHGMYPAPPDAPLPIASRTCRYYNQVGLRVTHPLQRTYALA
jgi:inosose dehydratase